MSQNKVHSHIYYNEGNYSERPKLPLYEAENMTFNAT